MPDPGICTDHKNMPDATGTGRTKMKRIVNLHRSIVYNYEAGDELEISFRNLHATCAQTTRVPRGTPCPVDKAITREKHNGQSG